MDKRRKVRKNIIRLFWVILLLPIITTTILFYLISVGKLGYIPSFKELENPKYNLASELYAEDQELIGKYFIQNRTFVEYKDLSPYLVKALISTEDVRFYRHSGIDVRGTLRAVVKTGILGNESSGGGSTITQQLAKLLYTSRSRAVWERIKQKLNEWVIAVKLEKRYTKEEILTLYLNHFDFLYQAVGIKSAAKVYFNTTPDSLNLEQSAMLVGMLKNPSFFNPRRRYDTTLYRRNTVLSQMVKYKNLDKKTYDSIKYIPLELNFQRIDHNEGNARYFWEYVRNTLTAKQPERRNYYSYYDFERDSMRWLIDPLYGWCNKNFKSDGSNYNIYSDGLKIYTTLNYKMQLYAEESVKEHLGGYLQPAFFKEKKGRAYAPFTEDLEKKDIDHIMDLAIRRSERYNNLRRAGYSRDSILASFHKPTAMTVFSYKGYRDTIMTPYDSIKLYKHYLRAGFISIDPFTGHVKAYIGGVDFKHFKFDQAIANNRQVGSTIKPFLYTLAMQEGYSPCFKVANVPTTFYVNDTTWTPRNSGSSKYEGKMVTLKWGLANSVNYISAWLIKQFNPESVVKLTKKMGITSFIDPVPSIFLGTSGISLMEMVSAYSVYANHGVYLNPIIVTRIEDKTGHVVSTFHPKPSEAMSERTAYRMINLMQGVVDAGTARKLRYRYQFTAPIAGKTGTTQNHSDGWFMGITPDLVSGAWVGAEDRAAHFDYIGMGAGASMALPIWALYMEKIYADSTLNIFQDKKFEVPEGMEELIDCRDNSNTNYQNDNYIDEEF